MVNIFSFIELPEQLSLGRHTDGDLQSPDPVPADHRLSPDHVYPPEPGTYQRVQGAGDRT